MAAPELVRGTSHGVTLLGDPHRPCGVTLAFTERGGGVSAGCYSSLNLGDACGDDADAVAANRERALRALGAQELLASLVNPLQVHGDRVVVVGGEGLSVRRAQQTAREGADAVVCLEPDVAVLLCSADCALVVLVAPGGFAVAHSGWRGTLARIAGKALRTLLRATGDDPADVRAYVGPHIGAADYEVSAELATKFGEAFGPEVVCGERNLDLGRAIALALAEEGVRRDAMVISSESTASATERFFSYRAQGGTCGRMGAIAFMRDEHKR